MTILSFPSSRNLTAGTIRNRVVYDIDNISKREINGGESVTESETEPHGDEELDYGPENQLGLPENQGVRFSGFDRGKESNEQGEFLFSCRGGLGWWFNIGDVKYANSSIQVDPVTNSSRSMIAVDFFPKSEETVSKLYLLTFLGLKWLWGQYIY